MSLSTTAIALLSVLLPQQGSLTEPKLLRYPTVSGNTIVFTYAGDLWVSTLQGGIARRLTSAPGVETRPRLSADGRTVAFTGSYDGVPNIYTIPIEGGEPKRLTYDANGDICLGWTPEGKIAYGTTSGNFVDRQERLGLVDPKGGFPQRTVIDEITEMTWLDSHTMAYTRTPSYLFNWRKYRGGSQGVISFYDFTANKYWELSHKREQSFFPMAAGKSLFYISDKSGGVINLFRYDLESKRETQITKYTDADIRTPSTDGKTIVWERDGNLNVFDIATGTITVPSVQIVAENLASRPSLRPLGNQISGITISPSGVRIAVEARGEIFSVPVKQGDTRNLTNTSGVRERFPQWSPDGKTIAYVSDATGNYEIYTQPQLGGKPTQLTMGTAGTIAGLGWSPDSKTIYFAKSDSTLNLLDLATKKVTQAIKADHGIGSLDWSPDSKWIAYTSPGANMLGNLYFYEVATGKTTKGDSGLYDDGQVAFDQNGKYLYMVSTRTFNPTFGQFEFSLKVDDASRVYVLPLAKDTANPLAPGNDEEASAPATPFAPPATPPAVPPTAPGGPAQAPTAKPTEPAGIKIDFDGMSNRLVPLPLPNGEYQALIGVNNGVLFYARGALSKFDLASKEATPIITGPIGNGAINPARTKFAYVVGATVGVIDIRPGQAFGAGKVDTSAVEAVIDPREEWKQIFWEAWRYERDHFYDSTMRGLDWPQVGKHYASYLPYVNSRSDLSYVLGLMIGELGTSHAYVSGGDTGAGARYQPLGYLGADFETVGTHYRFKKILKGHSYEESVRAPLADPGVDVKEGEFLLSIDGEDLNTSMNPEQLLLGKVERYVTLTVGPSADGKNSRKVRVKPVSNDSALRYWDWVDTTRAYVDKVSGGRIGYMHIRDTAAQGSQDFVRGYYAQTDKDAILVDERWNGGGYIQPWFVDTLARKTKAGIQVRNGADGADAVSIEGPKALLINGYAGSGGDFFPWLFHQAKLGPLIGGRTWGGLVGISGGAALVDGGSVTAPEFSIYDRSTGDIIAENHGVDPDILVDRRPDLIAIGKDAQIDAAIEYLLDELKKNPPPAKRKEFPRVNKDGRIEP